MNENHRKFENYREFAELGNAVVKQAVVDYVDSFKHSSSIRYRKECEAFFLSQYFNLFTDLDGKGLLEAITREIKNGNVNRIGKVGKSK